MSEWHPPQRWLRAGLSTWGKHVALIGLLALIELAWLQYSERASRATQSAETRAAVWIPGAEWSMDAAANWAGARVLLRSEPSTLEPDRLAGVALINLETQACCRVGFDASHPIAVALSPDAEWLVMAAPEQALRVLHRPTKADAEARGSDLDVGEPWVEKMAFSPNGRYLAVAGEQHIRMIDWATRRIVWMRPRATDLPPLLRFSADSNQLACRSGEQSLTVWDVAGGQELNQYTLETNSWMDALWSNEKQAWVLVAQEQGGLVALELMPHGDRRRLWKLHQRFRLASLAANGNRVAVADASGSQTEKHVCVLDLMTGTEAVRLPIPTSLAGLALSAEDQLFWWDRAGTVHVVQPQGEPSDRNTHAPDRMQAFSLTAARF